MPKIEVPFHDVPPFPPPLDFAVVDCFGVLLVFHRGVVVGRHYPAPNLREGDTVEFYYHLSN